MSMSHVFFCFVSCKTGCFPSHPDGRLSSMRLLQPEDLRHHVVSGGMQQDPSGS